MLYKRLTKKNSKKTVKTFIFAKAYRYLTEAQGCTSMSNWWSMINPLLFTPPPSSAHTSFLTNLSWHGCFRFVSVEYWQLKLYFHHQVCFSCFITILCVPPPHNKKKALVIILFNPFTFLSLFHSDTLSHLMLFMLSFVRSALYAQLLPLVLK